jgi:hypothetical protein
MVMPLQLFRTCALVLGVLAALSGVVLDGLLVRQVWQPLARQLEARSSGPVLYPPGLRFMLAHAWARRAYNLVFAALMFAVWWYLGTPAGARLAQY